MLLIEKKSSSANGRPLKIDLFNSSTMRSMLKEYGFVVITSVCISVKVLNWVSLVMMALTKGVGMEPIYCI